MESLYNVHICWDIFQVLISFFFIFYNCRHMFHPIGTHQYSQKLPKKKINRIKRFWNSDIESVFKIGQFQFSFRLFFQINIVVFQCINLFCFLVRREANEFFYFAYTGVQSFFIRRAQSLAILLILFGFLFASKKKR